MTKYEIERAKELNGLIEQLDKKFQELNLYQKIAFLLLNNLKSIEYEICKNDDVEKLIKKATIVSMIRDEQAKERLILSINSVDFTFLNYQNLNPFTVAKIVLKEFYTNDTIIAEIIFDFVHKCKCNICLTTIFNEEKMKTFLKATKDIIMNSLDNVVCSLKKIIEEKDEKLEKVRTENKDLNEKIKELISENLKLKSEIESLKEENQIMKEKLEKMRYVLDSNDFE